MKQKLLLLAAVLLCITQSYAQTGTIYNNGAHIVSTSGSYWVVNKGNVALTSESSVNLATMANLNIEADASLTISPKSYLTVNGTLTNSATNAGLVLQSTSNGTASLIHSTTNVPATVNRYLPGASQAWHLLSSPMVAQAISPAFTADPATSYDFFTWYEQNGVWVNFKNDDVSPTWSTGNGSPNFVAGRGYLVEYTGTGLTKLFAGNLNAGLVSLALTNTASGVYAGYNLVGNPYPSAMDWKATSWDRSSLVKSGGGYVMSVWNDASSTGNYGEFNSALLSNTGTNEVSQYIPVGQGFMVQAATSGNISSTDDVRVHADQAFLKSTEAVPNTLRLKVSGNANTYSDEIMIEFGHQTSEGGAEKMNSFYETAPSLFTVKTDGNYSIDFRGEPEAVTIPLSFKAGVDGNYTITASQLESFASTSVITLEDLKLAKKQDLTQNPVYNFVSSKNDDGARFLLHFGGAFGIGENNKVQPITVYAFGNTVYITNTSTTILKGDVFVYNTLGQMLLQQKWTGDNLTGINLNASTGYYLVKVITDGNAYTETVVLKR
jgi:hypothetical protein